MFFFICLEYPARHVEGALESLSDTVDGKISYSIASINRECSSVSGEGNEVPDQLKIYSLASLLDLSPSVDMIQHFEGENVVENSIQFFR